MGEQLLSLGGDWISAQEARALLLLVCPQKFSVTARGGGLRESKIGLCICLALELQDLSIKTITHRMFTWVKIQKQVCIVWRDVALLYDFRL